MSRTTKKRKLILYVFISSLFAMLVVLFCVEMLKYKEERAHLQYVTQAYAHRIEYALDTIMQKPKTLDTLVKLQPMDQSWFDRVAADLAEDPAVVCIQLAPHGAVSNVYPKDVVASQMAYPDIEKSALLAQNTSELTLSGPFKLPQGDLGLEGRQPIYIHNKKETFDFWGYSIVVVRLADILEKANLTQLADIGYSYDIKSINTRAEGNAVVAHSENAVGEKPIAYTMNIPNGKWILETAPTAGWISYERIAGQVLLCIVIAFLLTTVVVMFLKLHEKREVLRVMAVTDPLTKLSSRYAFMDVLEKYCQDLHRHFLLCYMDLDGFKEVNDTYGHDIGDRLIKAAAQRIKKCLKEEDQLFRIGGDEFVAIVEEEKNGGWKQRMESIEKESKRMFIFEGDIYIEISVSIGCAIYPQTSTDGETLLREADSRMYGNKEKYAWK